MPIQSAIRFLVGLLVLGLVLWCVYLLLSAIPLPAPFHTIVLVILGLIALLYLLNWSGILTNKPPNPPIE